MEKRISRVMRWLERCMYATKSKSWHNALTEMECARAELEEARKELWQLAETQGQEQKNKGIVVLSRVATLTVLFLCVLSVPLSVSQSNDSQKYVAKKKFSLEWVTSDERAVLAGLRKSLSESNIEALRNREEGYKNERDSLPISSVAMTTDVKQAKEMPIEKKELQNKKSVAKEDQQVGNANETLERLLTLLQIGQSALREQGPAIIINRQ